MPIPEVTPWQRRATASALGERPCWDAEIPRAAPDAATWPKLVITGTWETAEPLYWTCAGDPLTRANTRTADRIGADHNPHNLRPELVNPVPAAVWTGADRR